MGNPTLGRREEYANVHLQTMIKKGIKVQGGYVQICDDWFWFDLV